MAALHGLLRAHHGQPAPPCPGGPNVTRRAPLQPPCTISASQTLMVQGPGERALDVTFVRAPLSPRPENPAC